jgi:hypothetical protein
MTNLRTLLPAVLLIMLGSSQLTSASVTITGGFVHAYVFNDLGFVEDGSGTANSSATASLGGSLSMTQQSSNSQGIEHDFEQLRVGGSYYNDASGWSSTYFEVNANTSYSVFGEFANSLGGTLMNVVLFDITLGQPLFDQRDSNYATSPYTATVGTESGNQYAIIFGSAKGTLLAGHSYHFATQAHTQRLEEDNGATASGSFKLQFGDPNVEIVPEPASVAVWSGLGLGAICTTWVRRRKIAE